MGLFTPPLAYALATTKQPDILKLTSQTKAKSKALATLSNYPVAL